MGVVVKRSLNQDEKQEEATPAKMHFAFVLPFALIAAVNGGVVPATAVSENAVTSSQFHSQDEAGNFAFGYNNPVSHREESGNVETELSGDLTQMRGEGLSTMSLTNLDSGQLFESRSYQARPAQVLNKQLKHLQLCNWIFKPRVEETFLVVYCLKLDSTLIAIFPGLTNFPDGHS